MAGSVPRGIRKRINSAGQPRYQVRYLVRDPDSPSGWVETSSTFATLREARAFKADRDGEAAIGARRFDPRLGRVKLSAIWTQYSASKRPAVSPKTWSGYTQHWELRISPRFGHVPLDEISRKDVQQFIDTLTVGPWAKLATLRLLRSILDMAREDGRIHSNPAKGVSPGGYPPENATAISRPPKSPPWQRHAATRATSSRSWPSPVCAGPNSSACASATSTSRRAGSMYARPRRKSKAGSSSGRRNSRCRTNRPTPPNRHRRTQATNREPRTRGTSDHITERRLPQIKQLAPTHSLDPSPQENQTGAADHPRSPPHLRQPGPSLRRRPPLRPKNDGPLHANRHGEYLQRSLLR